MTLQNLPGQPELAYQGDALFLEQIQLSELAKAHGTPLFVYSRTSMLSALAAYQRGFAGRDVQICYAMKANPALGVIAVFAQAGCGFGLAWRRYNRAALWAESKWAAWNARVMARIYGITYDIEGTEVLRDGPTIMLTRHASINDSMGP